MSDNEVKLFSNMMLLLPKIEIKKSYTWDDYFYIFKLIDGYKHLEKYFHNNNIINDLLNKEINGKKIYDLIRVVKNANSHVEKFNEVGDMVLLQIKVDKSDLHKIINEIKKEMDNIFIRDLKSDAYRLTINTKPIINMFEALKFNLNDSESSSKLSDNDKLLIDNVMKDFDYTNSTFEEYNSFNSKIIDLYLNDLKDTIITKYGNNVYDELLRMLTDENYTSNDFKKAIEKILNVIN